LPHREEEFELHKPLVVFDFDGTLADTFQLFLKTFDAAAKIYGFRAFDRERMDLLRTMEASDVLRHHGVPFWKLPAIARTTRQFMAREIEGVSLVQGLGTALESLHEAGYTLAILTSNSRQNVDGVLGEERTRLFSHFECGVSILTKRQSLRKVMRALGSSHEHTSFVGDELRDLRAAKGLGVRFGAVAWGFNSMDSLIAHGAEDHFHSPLDLTRRFCEGR
jgi:phosphoglycolate phosphatase